jgi:uncharacterized protein HemX
MKRTRTALVAVAFVLGIGLGGGVALAVQPHMWSALNDLKAAQQQLQISLPDKAGHRVAAMGLVSQAIGEVQAGIAAGR